MRCPFCGNVDTQVKDSRPTDGGIILRRTGVLRLGVVMAAEWASH